MFKLISLASVGYFVKNNIKQLTSIILVVVLYAVLSDVIDTLKMPEYEYENKFLVIFIIYVFEVVVIVSALIFINLTYVKVDTNSGPEEEGESQQAIKNNTSAEVGGVFKTKTVKIINKAQNKVKNHT